MEPLAEDIEERVCGSARTTENVSDTATTGWPTPSDSALASGWVNADWAHNPAVQILYILVAVLGVVGNFVVLLVYFSRPQLRRHTTSVFIISLALTDLLTSLLIIPFKVITYPIPPGVFGEILCRVFISQYFLWASGGASAYTLFWVTVERHYAIIHPLLYDRYFTQRRAVWMCVSAYVVAMSLESYELVTFYSSDSRCVFNVTHVTRVLICIEGFCVLSINLVMFTVYMRIACILRQKLNRMRKEGISLSDPRQFETEIAKRRLAKMMFIVLGAYFTCWVSVGICNVWTAFWQDIYSTTFGEVAMLLATANSCMNPIIYCFQSKAFRKSFKKICLCKHSDSRSDVPIML